MTKTKKRPSVGVGVLVINSKGEILLSRRLKPYGFRKLALPGGHVEWMESHRETALREVKEESGIRLRKVEELRDYTEEINKRVGKHYVTFYLIAKANGQEPKDTEPYKHGPWGWYDPFNLPSYAWEPTKRLIKRSGAQIREWIERNIK
jgi:8-oxo-dGTP diphosphatase